MGEVDVNSNSYNEERMQAVLIGAVRESIGKEIEFIDRKSDTI